MRKNWIFLWILVVVAVGVPAAQASPISYDINFTISAGGALPSAGSFTYDSSTQTFSSFSVIWDGYTFDLAGSANSPSIVGNPCGGLTGGAASFSLLSGGCALDTVDWFAKVSPNPEFGFTTFDGNGNSILIWANSGTPAPPYDTAGGNWTIDSDPDTSPDPDDPDNAATPEPSSMSLIASALLSGTVFARKRIAEKLGLGA